MQISPGVLAVTKTYCDRRANLDVADIEDQVRFWQDHGQLGKSVVAADLLDLSVMARRPSRLSRGATRSIQAGFMANGATDALQFVTMAKPGCLRSRQA